MRFLLIYEIERRNNDRYQTDEGEENVESANENECENSGGVVEVIETSNVSLNE